jgi:hypothetical protein
MLTAIVQMLVLIFLMNKIMIDDRMDMLMHPTSLLIFENMMSHIMFELLLIKVTFVPCTIESLY